MSKKLIRWATILLVLAALLYAYASPYLVLNNIHKAAEQNDYAAISQYIDYSSVQESLKAQVKEKIEAGIQQKGFGNAGKFGAMLTEMLSSQLVEALVTPESIQLLFQGKALWDSELKPLASGTSQNAPSTELQSTTSIINSGSQTKTQNHRSDENLTQAHSQTQKNDLDFNAGYQSWKRFVVEIHQAHPKQDKIDVVLERRGLSWKVTQVLLPKS